jgi:hypothetical protein
MSCDFAVDREIEGQVIGQRFADRIASLARAFELSSIITGAKRAPGSRIQADVSTGRRFAVRATVGMTSLRRDGYRHYFHTTGTEP